MLIGCNCAHFFPVAGALPHFNRARILGALIKLFVGERARRICNCFDLNTQSIISFRFAFLFVLLCVPSRFARDASAQQSLQLHQNERGKDRELRASSLYREAKQLPMRMSRSQVAALGGKKWAEENERQL